MQIVQYMQSQGDEVFDGDNRERCQPFANVRMPIQQVTDTSVGPAAKQRERKEGLCTPTARHTCTDPFPLKLRRCLGCDTTLDNLDNP